MRRSPSHMTLAKKAAAWWLRQGGIEEPTLVAELLGVEPAALARTSLEAMREAAEAVARGSQKVLVVECRLARAIRCRACDGAAIDVVPCQACRRHDRAPSYSAPSRPRRIVDERRESAIREYSFALSRRRRVAVA